MLDLNKYQAQALGFLRILVALVFLAHPLATLFQFPVASPYAGPELSTLHLVAGTIELVGGAFIAAGFLTRIAAFICSGEMAVAYFLVHYPAGFWPLLNGGELAIIFCFFFLYLVFAGPGDFSAERLLRRGRTNDHNGTGGQAVS